jgi:hypothetical protein
VGDRKVIKKRLNKARFSSWDYKRRTESLAEAARFFRLDLNDVRQREKLLYLLADIVFGRGKKGRPRGSKSSWNLIRLGDLGQIYEEMRRQRPNDSDAEIARRINREHEEFRRSGADKIRQQLPAARLASLIWREIAEEKSRDRVAEPPDDWEPEDLDD